MTIPEGYHFLRWISTTAALLTSPPPPVDGTSLSYRVVDVKDGTVDQTIDPHSIRSVSGTEGDASFNAIPTDDHYRLLENIRGIEKRCGPFIVRAADLERNRFLGVDQQRRLWLVSEAPGGRIDLGRVSPDSVTWSDGFGYIAFNSGENGTGHIFQTSTRARVNIPVYRMSRWAPATKRFVFVAADDAGSGKDRLYQWSADQGITVAAVFPDLGTPSTLVIAKGGAEALVLVGHGDFSDIWGIPLIDDD